MSLVSFDQLPDAARLWIFGSERRLTDTEVAELHSHLNQFMQQWTAHKRELTTGWQLEHQRFILVGVDESRLPASGCSIDSLVRAIQAFERVVNCDIVNTHARVFYRDEQEIRCVPRPEFKKLVRSGAVDEHTVVFDNTIQRLRDLRAGNWEKPMKQSWHWEAFAERVVNVREG